MKDLFIIKEKNELSNNLQLKSIVIKKSKSNNLDNLPNDLFFDINVQDYIEE